MINKAQLLPFDFPGLIRVGNKYSDGGYVVPLEYVEKATLVLSLGLGYEWTFDDEVLRRNPTIKLVGVDHSISKQQFWRERCRLKLKVWGYILLKNKGKAEKYRKQLEPIKTYFRLFVEKGRHIKKMVTSRDSANSISFNSLMKYNASEKGHTVFVKMDIEGGEYEIIPSILQHSHSISVLVGEFHNIVEESEKFNRSISALLKNFTIIHTHGNNHGLYSESNDFPDTVEITFVNTSLVAEPHQQSAHSYPRPGLDVPNNPERPDYDLRF